MNKARGGEGIPVELFQILKDDALKVLHSIRQQIWPLDHKMSVFIAIPKKGKAKEHSNHTMALISLASKGMLQILQARLQQYVNQELSDVQAGFRKGRGNIKLPTPDQFSSVTQSCLTLCDPMNCSTPSLPVHHQLPEFTQTHVH